MDFFKNKNNKKIVLQLHAKMLMYNYISIWKIIFYVMTEYRYT